MATNTTRKTTTPAARKAATASAPQAARKAPAKGTAPAPARKAATAAKASPAPEQDKAAAPGKAARVRVAQPYVRKDRTRRATGSRVQVLDLLGTDAPADAIKPVERDGKALNHAARCVTHDTHEHYATYAAAYKAAKTSAEWCPACTTTTDAAEYPRAAWHPRR